MADANPSTTTDLRIPTGHVQLLRAVKERKKELDSATAKVTEIQREIAEGAVPEGIDGPARLTALETQVVTLQEAYEAAKVAAVEAVVDEKVEYTLAPNKRLDFGPPSGATTFDDATLRKISALASTVQNDLFDFTCEVNNWKVIYGSLSTARIMLFGHAGMTPASVVQQITTTTWEAMLNDKTVADRKLRWVLREVYSQLHGDQSPIIGETFTATAKRTGELSVAFARRLGAYATAAPTIFEAYLCDAEGELDGSAKQRAGVLSEALFDQLMPMLLKNFSEIREKAGPSELAAFQSSTDKARYVLQFAQTCQRFQNSTTGAQAYLQRSKNDEGPKDNEDTSHFTGSNSVPLGTKGTCRFFARGNCSKGSKCDYSHEKPMDRTSDRDKDRTSDRGRDRTSNDQDRGKQIVDRTSTGDRSCWDFARGTCNRAHCRFSHGEASPRKHRRERNTNNDRDSDRSGETCRKFQRGACSRNPCRFSHKEPQDGKSGSAVDKIAKTLMAEFSKQQNKAKSQYEELSKAMQAIAERNEAIARHHEDTVKSAEKEKDKQAMAAEIDAIVNARLAQTLSKHNTETALVPSLGLLPPPGNGHR